MNIYHPYRIKYKKRKGFYLVTTDENIVKLVKQGWSFRRLYLLEYIIFHIYTYWMKSLLDIIGISIYNLKQKRKEK
jgi:hypothetical protein